MQTGFHPQTTEYVSPSSVQDLRECLLRHAFSKDKDIRGQVLKSPAARLGSASHRLLERVNKGELKFTPREEWQPQLVKIWDEEISEEEQELLESTAERHFGEAVRWRNYAMRRARTLRFACRMLEERSRIGQGQGHLRAEKYYKAYDGRLRGRVDRLLVSSSGTVEITDYKTGKIRRQSGQGMALKEEYRSQVLLYAAMHHDESDTWPVTGRIVSISGEEEIVTIDPSEAEEEAAGALELLSQYNAATQRPEDSKTLASPSEEHCRYCAYKAFCEPFWNCVSAEWDWEGSIAVLGEARDVQEALSGDWRANIAVRAGNLPVGEYKIRASRDLSDLEGQVISATNLRLGHNEEELLVTDYTEIQRTKL